jgi:hypothetical protein
MHHDDDDNDHDLEIEVDGVEVDLDDQPVMRRFRVTYSSGLQGVFRSHFYETTNAGILTFITRDTEGRYWHRLSINSHSWLEVAELVDPDVPAPEIVGLVPKGSPVH